MNRSSLFLVLAVPIVFVGLSFAAEGDSPAVEQTASPSETAVKEAAAPAPEPKPVAEPAAKPEVKPEVKAEAKPDAKPEVKPEVKREAKSEAKAEVKPEAKPEPKPEVKPEAKTAAKSEEKPSSEAKPLNSSADKFSPVVDAYQQAHDGLAAWLKTASGKMDAVDAKIADLKKSIGEKESKITQLKLEDSRKNKAQVKDLDKEVQGLWAQLKGEDARRKELGKGLSAAAGRKVRELNQSALDQFEKAAKAE